MNTDQILSIVRSLLKSGGTVLITHGYISNGTAEFWAGLIMAVIGFICSHVAHKNDNDPQGQLFNSIFWVGIFVTCLGVGCSTVRTHLEVIETQGTNSVRRITDTTGRSFFDSKNSLAKWTTSNAEKTQRSGIDGLSQESSSSNLVKIVIEGAAIAGKSAVVP